MDSIANAEVDPLQEDYNVPDIPDTPDCSQSLSPVISPNEAQGSETFLMAIKDYNQIYVNQVLSRFGNREISQEEATTQIDRLVDTHKYNAQLCNEKLGFPGSRAGVSMILTIPREIRQEILRYMLLSPILGTRKAVKIQNSTHKSRYEFEINILLPCRVLNEEGTAILYGENKFYNVCCDGHYWQSTHQLMNANPITRYVEECDPIWSRSKLAADIMRKVEH